MGSTNPRCVLEIFQRVSEMRLGKVDSQSFMALWFVSLFLLNVVEDENNDALRVKLVGCVDSKT